MSQDTRTGLVFDDRYLQHNPGLYTLWGTGKPLPFVDAPLHLTNHRLVMRSKHLIDLSGLSKRLTRVEPYLAEVDDITVYHTPEYIEHIRVLCEAGGGEAGEGTPVGPDSYEIALLAAGGAMAAVDAVVEGRVQNAFANIRPPGHHAMRDKAMGFCVFSNVVIAARHAQRKHGIERVMILDWDVHDGNGTQDAFYGDPNVLFFSLHQEHLYPEGFGELEQNGAGAGEGYTINLPLPPGSGDAVYRAAFERIVLPIANEFKPQLILVSAGQDASMMDQLGRMCLTTEAYRFMTQALMDVAEQHADGRLVILQEGGYSEVYGPYCTLAIVETLAGTRTNIDEPQPVEYLANQPHFTTVNEAGEAALRRIRDQAAKYWTVLQVAVTV
jgi:acetoin utilization deacetylase AcuC-like enzyme